MKTPSLRHLALAIAALVALAVGQRAAAQSCTTPSDAAQRLYGTNFMDSALFGGYSEDAAFFSNTRGKPNVYFLFDNSGSMKRLPPNGASFFAGSFQVWQPTQKTSSGWTYGSLPPLKDFSTCTTDATATPPSNGDAADPGCAYKNLKDPTTNDASATSGAAFLSSWSTSSMGSNVAVMGCGDDDVSAPFVVAPTASMPYGSLLYWLRSLPYAAPCDDYAVPGDGLPFDSTRDYADAAKACATYDGTAAGTTGLPGFDPDFYCGTGKTCSRTSANCGGTCPTSVGNFFDKSRIFHDVTINLPGNNYPGDGWEDSGVCPNGTTTACYTDAKTFCDGLYGTTRKQGTLTKTSICQSCLNTRGFVLDGRLWRVDQEGIVADKTGHYQTPVPSIWYSGNFLNFYPPKFIIARKVLKDLLRKQNNVRVGIQTFSDSMNPYPICSNIDTPFDPKAAITFVNKESFDSGTPTPTTLLTVGQSFHTKGRAWFSTTNTSGDFSNGGVTDPAICYQCQKNSLVLITDGLPNAGTGIAGNTTTADAGSKYAGDVNTGTNDIDVSSFATSATAKAEFATMDAYKRSVIQLSWYLHNMDLRTNTENGIDCQAMDTQKQVMDVFTVGFAANSLPYAGTMLQMAASAGGGTYTNADNPKALVSALNDVMNRVSSRATTFSVASISTLQSTAGSAVIVPRFSPVLNPPALQPPFFPGHLFRFDLYSEFTNQCAVQSDGTVANDVDCDGSCSGVFLTDADGDFIAEDGVTGQYFKLSSKRPLCSAAKHCAGDCSTITTAPANPWWDANVSMQYPLPTGVDAPQAPLPPQRTWKDRPVYTVVDSNADGKIDAADTVILLGTDDATVAKLLPYLNLGGTSATCSQIATQLSGIDATESALVSSSKTECAKTIVRYVLGADVFNTRFSPLYPMANQDDLLDRKDKLGDIFHSSPVVIDPPLSPTGLLCPLGLHDQCLPSLWRTPTPHEPAAGNAYGDYADKYKNRTKIVLVGANDGLLHAFNGGMWHDLADDPDLKKLSPPIYTSGSPYFGYYDRGDGSELWSFLPPDMLAKVGQLLLSTVAHPAFVDGTPMVRDVWADGTANGSETATDKDDRKQAREFHTVAVIGERRGGTHYFALDVTDASYEKEDATHFAPPKFLWIYPQPNSTESFDFGETYTDFLPTPPPIGPIRMAVDTDEPALPATQTFGSTAYHEKWIAFLSGGFDPAYQRGRGVHMVDVWTGTELFDFSKPPTPVFDSTDPRWGLDYPVTAPVGMTAWGKNAYQTEGENNQYFFDTATFGDAGGQLWVIRFSDPGARDATTKLVGNWYGGRIFQMGGVGATDIAKGLPFFYITANVALSDNGAYRVLAGTGDRYNLLDTYGGTCKPENIRACLQAGCLLNNASSPPATLACSTGGLGGSTYTTKVTSANGTPTRTSASLAVPATCSDTASVSLAVSACPTALFGSTATAVSLSGSVSCDNDASSVYGCDKASVAHPAPLPFLTGQTNPRALHNWYYSLRVFDKTGARALFTDLAGAKAYDGARLFLADGATPTYSSGLVLIDGSVSTAPSTVSSSSGVGYAVKLAHSGLVTFPPKTYAVNEYDERTSSPTAVVSQCAFFNSTQRSLSETNASANGCTTTKAPYCTASNRNVNYFYGVDAASGGFCGLTDPTGVPLRSVTSATLVPPPAPQFTTFVNDKGQVQFGLTAVQSETGATNIGQGGISDPAMTLGVLPIDRKAHACRHDGTCN